MQSCTTYFLIAIQFLEWPSWVKGKYEDEAEGSLVSIFLSNSILNKIDNYYPDLPCVKLEGVHMLLRNTVYTVLHIYGTVFSVHIGKL